MLYSFLRFLKNRIFSFRDFFIGFFFLQTVKRHQNEFDATFCLGSYIGDFVYGFSVLPEFCKEKGISKPLILVSDRAERLFVFYPEILAHFSFLFLNEKQDFREGCFLRSPILNQKSRMHHIYATIPCFFPYSKYQGSCLCNLQKYFGIKEDSVCLPSLPSNEPFHNAQLGSLKTKGAILLNISSNSLRLSNLSIFNRLVAEFSKLGIFFYLNFLPGQRDVPGTVRLEADIHDLFLLAPSFLAIISIRSGILDLLACCGAPIISIFSKKSNEKWRNNFQIKDWNSGAPVLDLCEDDPKLDDQIIDFIQNLSGDKKKCPNI